MDYHPGEDGDRLADIEIQILAMKATVVYCQCEMEVLRGLFEEMNNNTRIEGMEVGDFLRDRLEKRLLFRLSELSDRNPALATALTKILEAGKHNE